MEDLAKNLKDCIERVIRKFLPEGKRCTAVIQTLTDEIHHFFDEKADSEI